MHRLVVVRFPERRSKFFEKVEGKRVALLGPVEGHAGPVLVDFVTNVLVALCACQGDLQELFYRSSGRSL